MEIHNNVATILHQKIAIDCKLLDIITPDYKYESQPVLDSNYVLYRDRHVITDRHIQNDRPDKIIIDKVQKTGHIIDIAVPSTQKITQVENEKLEKHQGLLIEIKRIWKLFMVEVVPGIILKRFNESLKNFR